MKENAHPELDTSTIIDSTGIERYQSAIGMLLWTVTLGRMDIAFAVMTLSRFRVQPRAGHVERMLQIFGYLRKFPDEAIHFRTGRPSHDAFQPGTYRWEKLQYRSLSEEVPYDQPTPRGLAVRISAWFDANIYHDMVGNW